MENHSNPKSEKNFSPEKNSEHIDTSCPNNTGTKTKDTFKKPFQTPQNIFARSKTK